MSFINESIMILILTSFLKTPIFPSKIMKVLLINPPTKHGMTVIRDNLFGCFTKSKADYLWPPINLALLGAVLKEAKAKPLIIDAVAVKYTKEELGRNIKAFSPDYILLVTASASFDSDVAFIQSLKKSFPKLKSIIIGNHITLYPDISLKKKGVDYLILGEPELTLKEMFVRLKNKKSLDELHGIAFRKGKKILINNRSLPIEDLDVLPFADRRLIPRAEYFNPLVKALPYTTMNTSRGCPFSCIYCAAGITYGKRYRARSAKNVVDEIEICVNDLGYREILFRDEEFTLDKKRIRDICRLIIKRRVKVHWICNSRIDTLDDKTLMMMARAGCHMIKLGVESGSDKMLKNMKKGVDVAAMRKNFKLIKKHGIRTVAHFIIGLPGETKQTLNETRRFVFEIEPDYISFNIAVPYPGTELFQEYKHKLKDKSASDYDIEKGLVKANFTEMFCNLTPKYLEDYYNRIHKDFYFRPRYIIKRLIGVSSLRELFRYGKAGINLLKFTASNK